MNNRTLNPYFNCKLEDHPFGDFIFPESKYLIIGSIGYLNSIILVKEIDFGQLFKVFFLP